MSQLASLLDPEFVGELEALRRRLEIRARSGRLGDKTARRRGGTAEFSEHRAYEPGDDLRRVDWLAFARTGDPSCKSIGNWPVYGKDRMTMILDKDCHVEEAPYEEERLTWESWKPKCYPLP